MTLEQLLRDFPVSTGEVLAVVTEVTRMSRGLYCVAGMNLHDRKMMRPLMADGSNWHLGSKRDVFHPGHVIRCVPTGVRAAVMPHATEDTRLSRLPEFLLELSESELYALLLPTAKDSIALAIGAQPIDNKYVEEGTKCRSLGGVSVVRDQIRFSFDWGKLRLALTDSDGADYDLKVTSDWLQHVFSPSDEEAEPHFGVDEANEWLDVNTETDKIILRVGLARPWDGRENNWSPLRCYLQLNGIVCSTDNWHIFAGPPGKT
jgi:hypothetical protein